MHSFERKRSCVLHVCAMTLYVFVLATMTLFTAAEQSAAAPVAAADKVRAAMERTLRGTEPLSLPLKRMREVLISHYLDSNGPLLWVGTPKLQQLIDRFKNAETDALKSADYPSEYLIKLRKAANFELPGHAAFTELMFSSFFLVYASDVKVGRFVPSKIDPELFLEHQTINGAATLASLAKFADLESFIEDWQPRRPEYRALKSTLALYRRIEASGGWPGIESGEVIKPGMEDPRVAELRARLLASGDLAAAGPESIIYDESLVRAVKKFQRRHGLDTDGIIGKQTRIALNIKVSARINQIVANMERWRWMPKQLGDDYIMVNIAGFELKRVQRDQVVRRMNVVVGKTYHRTPVFSDKIRYLEFNPTWTVPYSIASKEMLPELQKDPDRYISKGFDLLQRGRRVPWHGINWLQYSSRNLPYMFRQRPGDTNALGRVKFMFPNKHNVYLHDTPARNLFSRSYRALSHGCVRLAEPISFAEEVLANKSGWSRDRIDAVLASRETTRVNLDRPLPVHLIYATAWLEEDGLVHFRADIYGRDKRLYRALFAKHTP